MTNRITPMLQRSTIAPSYVPVMSTTSGAMYESVPQKVLLRSAGRGIEDGSSRVSECERASEGQGGDMVCPRAPAAHRRVFREAEVRDLDFHLCRHQDVFELEVEMAVSKFQGCRI